ncbi:MAG: transglutaminase domain-containing protein [Sedimentisphaerales bacterium]|nr:transglutaminase domain-containing protein [Sedimentisphaerales bacterium]
MKVLYLFTFSLMLIAAHATEPELTETEYFAVFMEGKKVGHSIQSRVVAADKVTTTEKVSITISRVGTAMNMNMTATFIETTDGKPLGFETIREVSGMVTKIAGIVNKDQTVSLTTTSMGAEQKSSFEWPKDAKMAEGLRLLALKKGLKQGTTYTASPFNPAVLQALDTQITVGPKQNVDLLGRVVALTEVVSKQNMPGTGQIVSTSYVDENLRVQKNIVPLMGIQIEVVACHKNFALGNNDVFDLLDKMFLASPVSLGNIDPSGSITYDLAPTQTGNTLNIPFNDNQKVRHLKNGSVIVTVKPVEPPKGASFPYSGNDQVILEALKPTPFIQSNEKKIIDLATQAVGDTKDAAEAACRIESFVAEYINRATLSVGYASALEVANSRQGDCSEFAVLTTAMCRAVGIPAQMVVGIAYVKDFAGLKDRFGGHAWVQVYIGQKWIGLDPAFKNAGLKGYGPGHIILAIGNGDPKHFLNLVTTMGKFKIDKIVVNKPK